MKKLLITIIAVLATVTAAGAAGTMTGGAAGDWADIGHGQWAITISWLDDTAGTTGTIYVPAKLYGLWAGAGITDPGTTAPTDNYDISVTSAVTSRWAGLDIFDGNLLNRDTATTEKSTWSFAPFPVYGPLTFTLSGNAVNNATGTLTIILSE